MSAAARPEWQACVWDRITTELWGDGLRGQVVQSVASFSEDLQPEIGVGFVPISKPFFELGQPVVRLGDRAGRISVLSQQRAEHRFDRDDPRQQGRGLVHPQIMADRSSNTKRSVASADSLNRNGHADGTNLERGRAGRGEHGIADRIVRQPRRPALELVQ